MSIFSVSRLKYKSVHLFSGQDLFKNWKRITTPPSSKSPANLKSWNVSTEKPKPKREDHLTRGTWTKIILTWTALIMISKIISVMVVLTLMSTASEAQSHGFEQSGGNPSTDTGSTVPVTGIDQPGSPKQCLKWIVKQGIYKCVRFSTK